MPLTFKKQARDTSRNELQRQLNWPQFRGAVFYVHSGTGSDSYGGRSPKQPVATLDYAIGLCTANRGDTIVLLPGHAETKSATGSFFAADIAGVTVVSLGEGADRATFTFSHTGAAATISANGVRFVNCLFVAGVDSITAPITISATDWTLDACEFRDTTDVEAVRWLVTTAAADRGTVRDCVHDGYTGGNAAVNFARLVGVDSCLFERCRFFGEYSTAVIEFHTTACKKIEVRGCLFLETGTTDFSKAVVDTVTGSTWAVTGNSFDMGAGAYFGGGSGAALAGVSVSAITDALYGANGVVSWPASAEPANGVSIAEGLRWVNDALQGANGVVTFPAAAAPANGVSLAEVIRSIYDRQLGNATTCAANTLLGNRVNRATADVITGSAVPIYTITGRVLLTQLIGEVTTVIGAGASNAKFQFNPTTGTTNDMCANLDIDADEAGTLYSLTGTPGDAMLRSESAAVRGMSSTGIILGPGQIEFLGGTDRTGSISFQAWYIPLDDGATLAAA